MAAVLLKDWFLATGKHGAGYFPECSPNMVNAKDECVWVHMSGSGMSEHRRDLSSFTRRAVVCMPGTSIMFSVEPRQEDHFFPGTESSSYLFHLTPQPVDATSLSFGDSSVAYLVDGDSRAGCGGMNGSHCKGNTQGVCRNYIASALRGTHACARFSLSLPPTQLCTPISRMWSRACDTAWAQYAFE